MSLGPRPTSICPALEARCQAHSLPAQLLRASFCLCAKWIETRTAPCFPILLRPKPPLTPQQARPPSSLFSLTAFSCPFPGCPAGM